LLDAPLVKISYNNFFTHSPPAGTKAHKNFDTIGPQAVCGRGLDVAKKCGAAGHYPEAAGAALRAVAACAGGGAQTKKTRPSRDGRVL
jgi:hypothetical protein